MQRHDDLNVPAMAYWGVLSCIITIALVLGVQVVYHRAANSERQKKVVSVLYADTESVLAAQEAQLARYGWLDREAGVAAIPIERAMELVVREGLAGKAARSEGAP